MSIDITPELDRPDYYALASGEQFCDWFDRVIYPSIDHLDGRVYAKIVSASEHFWRHNFKPGESSDMKKFRWWISEAKNAYRKYNFELFPNHADERFDRIVGPILDEILVERKKKWQQIKQRNEAGRQIFNAMLEACGIKAPERA